MKHNNVLIIENNAINKVCETLKNNGISGKILYVSDTIVNNLYGQIVKDQIETIGVLKEELVENNTISYAMNLAERIIATDINCIIGLGGGKVLDVCKYAAYVSKIPFLSIPTTMANDGIASPVAVLKRNDDKPKSLLAKMPDMLLLDTGLILKSPIELLKAGIGDTISNYTALMDWDLAANRGHDTINGYAYMISKASLDGLLKTQYDKLCPEFVGVLANSLVLSGLAMNFAGSSRPVSGSEHLFSHALDYYAKNKNLHGIQVALGTIAMLKILNKDYSTFLNYIKKFEVNLNPKSLNIDRETFILCMQKASSMRNRYTHLNELDLSDKFLTKIYDELVEEL